MKEANQEHIKSEPIKIELETDNQQPKSLDPDTIQPELTVTEPQSPPMEIHFVNVNSESKIIQQVKIYCIR